MKNFSVSSESCSSDNTNLSVISRFKSINSYSRNINDIELDLVNIEVPENEKAFKYLRTVGIGSFGVACLYKRLADEVEVVLKRINLIELTKQEREMAMNEVNVIIRLHHPNIIQYYGNFIKGEVLYIGKLKISI